MVILGMGWGIQMAGGDDHLLAPAHAHLNLLGWVGFSVFAFYYHLVPQAAQGLLPRAHFAFSAGGVATLVPGNALAIRDHGDKLVRFGSVLSLVSMQLFLCVVMMNARRRQNRRRTALAREHRAPGCTQGPDRVN
ncbi:hypothetical protein ACFMPD_15240 [Sedimentitalea sp. HM32M-2]